MSTQPKHTPQRTCVACHELNSKRELLRLVRTPAGVVVDPTGKKAGRGAYLHKKKSCWQKALAHQALEEALKTTLTPTEREQLRAQGETLPA